MDGLSAMVHTDSPVLCHFMPRRDSGQGCRRKNAVLGRLPVESDMIQAADC